MTGQSNFPSSGASVASLSFDGLLSLLRRILDRVFDSETFRHSLAVSAGALLWFYPFLILTCYLLHDLLQWHWVLQSVYQAIGLYFPGDLSHGVFDRRLPPNGRIQLSALLFLLLLSNVVFLPLRNALNRAWPAVRKRHPLTIHTLQVGLSFVCSGLALASMALSALNWEWIANHVASRGLDAIWVNPWLFKLAAAAISILGVFLVGWLLPDSPIPPKKLVPFAISGGLRLEAIKYAMVFAASLIRIPFHRALGPFYDHIAVMAWSFAAVFAVLSAANAMGDPKAAGTPRRKWAIEPVIVAAAILLAFAVAARRDRAADIAQRQIGQGEVRIPPQVRTFEPKKFWTSFSGSVPPALRINPGDTVRTFTVDNGGYDANRVRRSGPVNPQTGPFYIEGAAPGDTLVVKLVKIRLNRTYAESGAQLIPEAVTNEYLYSAKYGLESEEEWFLNLSELFARPARPSKGLGNFRVRILPILGCIAVAPPNGEIHSTTTLGSWGGNLDYRELQEGTTLYLPVYHSGALLFIGDGHAAQGAGELLDSGIETTLDVELTIGLRPGEPIDGPRAESSTHLMAMGIDDSVPMALKRATSELAKWLERDYRLTPHDSALVLGTSVSFDIAQISNPRVNVVARIEKSVVARLAN